MAPQLPHSNDQGKSPWDDQRKSRRDDLGKERVLLVGAYVHPSQYMALEDSLAELSRLAESADAVVVRKFTCELKKPYPATFLGRGKIQELVSFMEQEAVQAVILNDDITPTQNRNLEKELGVKVIDRTGLILDIFARRARTREGKLQVELAQLKYLLPRLVGKGTVLSRLGGGIGTRGPGETKLEVDRRRARDRMTDLKAELRKLRTHRDLHRQKRVKGELPLVSLVGYTNAGKSTLMNFLTRAGVSVQDKLFATLDPTVRRLRLPSGREILLADTVGFVDKLPHQLVEAFKATFEELEGSSLLLHVIDGSHPLARHQAFVVEQVLVNLELGPKERIRVLNKIDISHDRSHLFADAVKISALKGRGVPELLQKIDERLSSHLIRVQMLLPHDCGADLSNIYRSSRIIRREDRAQGIYLEVEMGAVDCERYRGYKSSSS